MDVYDTASSKLLNNRPTKTKRMRAWSVIFPRCEPAWTTVNHCEQHGNRIVLHRVNWWGLRCVSQINLDTHKRRVGHGNSLPGSHFFLLIPFAPSFLLYLCTTLWKIPLVHLPVRTRIHRTNWFELARQTYNTHSPWLLTWWLSSMLEIHGTLPDCLLLLHIRASHRFTTNFNNGFLLSFGVQMYLELIINSFNLICYFIILSLWTLYIKFLL